MQRKPRAARRLPPQMVRAVEAARSYLDEHYAERVLLEDIGKVASVSPFHLARLFKAHVGTSPHRYLMLVRIDRAMELLCTTELSVSQVGQRVGFASLSHFTMTFRSETGSTPTDFRRTRCDSRSLRLG
jgi:AraC family transcriptional regulator